MFLSSYSLWPFYIYVSHSFIVQFCDLCSKLSMSCICVVRHQSELPNAVSAL